MLETDVWPKKLGGGGGGGVLKLGAPSLGVPVTRIIIYWGTYWGSPILGSYQLNLVHTRRFGGLSPRLCKNAKADMCTCSSLYAT